MTPEQAIAQLRHVGGQDNGYANIIEDLMNRSGELRRAAREVISQIDQGGSEGKVFARDACVAGLRSAIAMIPAPPSDPADDDIPDTPDQRALIAAHNKDMRRKYPNMDDLIWISPAATKEDGITIHAASTTPQHGWEPYIRLSVAATTNEKAHKSREPKP
jgi:hypothetical protein